MQQTTILRVFIIAIFIFMIALTYAAANYGWWVVNLRNPVVMRQYYDEYDYTYSNPGFNRSNSRSNFKSGTGSGSSKSKNMRSGTGRRSFASGSRSGGGK